LEEENPELPPTSIQITPFTLQGINLQSLLLALTRQSNPPLKKRYCNIKEPDPFSSSSLDELCAFIFQCQIYFWAYEGKFAKNTEKIFFAISYLRGVALDYFKLFINEPDPHQSLDFLED